MSNNDEKRKEYGLHTRLPALTKNKDIVLGLTDQYQSLFTKIEKYYGESGFTSHAAFAASLEDVSEQEIDRFLTKSKAVMSGRVLIALGSIVDELDSVEKILELSPELPSSLQGLAVFPRTVVELLFSISFRYIELGSSLYFKDAFEEHSETVQDALNFSKAAGTALQDEDVFDFVLDVVTSPDLAERLEAIARIRASQSEKFVQEFLELYAKFANKAGSKIEVARRLNVSVDTIRRAEKGEASEKMLCELIEQIKKQLHKADDQTSDFEDTEYVDILNRIVQIYGSQMNAAVALGISRDSVQKGQKGKLGVEMRAKIVSVGGKILKDRQESQQSSDSTSLEKVSSEVTPEMLLKQSGEVSTLGVRNTLGPNSFRSIEVSVGHDDIVLAKDAFEKARAWLNFCAQIEDDSFREEIRIILGPEVDELELAIRLFSQMFPSDLIGLHASQRKSWAENAERQPHTKKG